MSLPKNLFTEASVINGSLMCLCLGLFTEKTQ